MSPSIPPFQLESAAGLLDTFEGVSSKYLQRG